jgi:cell fate regulator YaaT (PSP1 superfamily)
MSRYIVRHGVMRNLGVFAPRGRDTFTRGDQVIARTSRGLESGEVLCEASDEAVATIKDAKQGQILRRLSGDDVRELRKMFEQERREYEVCQREIKRLALEMKLVDVEHLYGGERVVVYYLADERVDFRDLVKSLATEFQTRIEMRQIGVRDEAKLLADYGDCGKPVCCNTHLSEMPPVSMKMAKLQRATLDPSKISGRCGRLKCCLRYEYDTYQELQRELPPIGADVITNKGRARVLAQEVLAGQVLVETEDMRRIVIDAADVLTVLKREKRPREGQTAPDTEEPPSKPCRPSWPIWKTPSCGTTLPRNSHPPTRTTTSTPTQPTKILSSAERSTFNCARAFPCKHECFPTSGYTVA